jgi:hypothetical protein
LTLGILNKLGTTADDIYAVSTQRDTDSQYMSGIFSEYVDSANKPETYFPVGGSSFCLFKPNNTGLAWSTSVISAAENEDSINSLKNALLCTLFYPKTALAFARCDNAYHIHGMYMTFYHIHDFYQDVFVFLNRSGISKTEVRFLLNHPVLDTAHVDDISAFLFFTILDIQLKHKNIEGGVYYKAIDLKNVPQLSVS